MVVYWIPLQQSIYHYFMEETVSKGKAVYYNLDLGVANCLTQVAFKEPSCPSR